MPAQRNYVLIDYENVQPDLMPLLSETNIYVIIFVGAAQKSVPVDFAAAMQRLGSRATYIKLSGNGSNALDFHIAFYLGVLAVRDSAAYFTHYIERYRFRPADPAYAGKTGQGASLRGRDRHTDHQKETRPSAPVGIGA